DNDLPLPIGTQDAEMLDPGIADAETLFAEDDDDNGDNSDGPIANALRTDADFKQRAGEIYKSYAAQWKRRFKWLRPGLFVKQLATDLREDIDALLKVLKLCGDWDAGKDAKLAALTKLLTEKHPQDKVLVFTQFADTVDYLENQLRSRGITRIAGVTGDAENPTAFAWRFSPVSNEKRAEVTAEQELRVLIATDVLSEGQNLQDCSVVVNFDLPWAIIRLIQRAGRVDRIGQRAENILCHSFLPADGVERIIRLRSRVRQRLTENAEVLGTDEAFFEGDAQNRMLDLFHEKAGILDGEAETEVDLASFAYQIWKNAITADATLQKTIPDMPPVVFATKAHQQNDKEPPGVLVYLRTAEGNDALAWIDKQGNSVTESQFAILKAAECTPEAPALPRQDDHHGLVEKAVQLIVTEEKTVGGQLGRPSGARFRTYERLKRHAEQVKGTLFESQELLRAIDDIYRYPLRPTTIDTLNRQLRSGISDEELAALVVALRDEDRLCLIHEDERTYEPRIICSLGLRAP
ncbi:MAG TPA: helicase-related protein, partial [Pirellulales bacterium]|nr:helicase-related protein [Pirellulales bacterium]